MQKDIRSDKLNPGFSDTAAFFQARGMKARDPLDKDRLMETAEFYRSLAVIVPRFPPGYKSPAFSGNKFMDRAEDAAPWRRALETLKLAISS
jgi:hypothetical protein